MYKRSFIAAAILVSESLGNYLSGEIKTTGTFKYGRFVTRMKSENRNGTVASFFTYWTGPDWSVGQWNEIDVEIVPSVQQSLGASPFSTNLIYGSGSNYNLQEQSYQGYNSDFSQFHTYEIEWTPDYISWKVDGVQVRKSNSTESAGVRFMDKNQVIMMNFWTPCWSPWGDNLDDSSMPWYVEYDYVETYDYDVSSNTFNLRFRDDFDGA